MSKKLIRNTERINFYSWISAIANSNSNRQPYFLPLISQYVICTICLFSCCPLVWHSASLVWVYLELALDIAHLSHFSLFFFCLFVLFCPLFHFIGFSSYFHVLRSFCFVQCNFQWVRLQVVFLCLFNSSPLIWFHFYFLYFWVLFILIIFFFCFFFSFSFFSVPAYFMCTMDDWNLLCGLANILVV